MKALHDRRLEYLLSFGRDLQLRWDEEHKKFLRSKRKSLFIIEPLTALSIVEIKLHCCTFPSSLMKESVPSRKIKTNKSIQQLHFVLRLFDLQWDNWLARKRNEASFRCSEQHHDFYVARGQLTFHWWTIKIVSHGKELFM